MDQKEKKPLLAITKSGDNINVEINKDNLKELQAVAKLAASNPEIKAGLADMFRNIVDPEGQLHEGNISRYAGSTGTVSMQMKSEFAGSAEEYSAGIELLTAALSDYAAKAIAHGLNEADVLEQLIERFAASLTAAIPSVQIKTLGDLPIDDHFGGNGRMGGGGKSRLLS